MICRFVLILAVVVLALPVSAQPLSVPSSARQVSSRVSPLDSYALPVAPFDGQAVPARTIEGAVDRQTWRVDGTAATTLQLLAPLRDQIQAAGYTLVFQCRDRECGGFDFRFGTEIVPAPDMHVDIRNYRFLSAVREPDKAVSLLVSRGRNAAYIQIIRVAPPGAADLRVEVDQQALPAEPAPEANSLTARLAQDGHVILKNLDFASGAETLEPGHHDSLAQLAAYLRAHPGQRIALVGHTDSAGSLQNNIELSRRRAGAVRARLLQVHGIAPDRVEAEGMGYLAPVASNLTPEGREANRRVEAILLSDR
ncbi:OmpA family protein [Sedimentitalea sp. HM32M-2]|uniref:OmpA family protein n=1 Tax=Sedimentitalea sp. HM32M-2 TaxID=3351566 RepID=UPI00362AAADB